jgi:hypothetical protein
VSGGIALSLSGGGLAYSVAISLKHGVEFAGFFPAQNVQLFDELADTVDLGTEQAELNNLFVAEILGELGIDFVLVDSMLALFLALSNDANDIGLATKC